jgi:Fe-S cluster biogenesis protein NfuA
MNEHDTIPPDVDRELRRRVQSLAERLRDDVDVDEGLERLPRRMARPAIRILAVAACIVAVLVAFAVLTVETDPVETLGQPPQTVDCPNQTQPRAPIPGGTMNIRLARPLATVTAAVALLGACSDDSSSTATTQDTVTTIAKGEDIELQGDTGDLSSQTLNIDVTEQGGEVTGEFRVTDNVIAVQCADTDTEGLVILGGAVTSGPDVPEGDLLALVIRDGDPDGVALESNSTHAKTCEELLAATPADHTKAGSSELTLLEDGSDIELG